MSGRLIQLLRPECKPNETCESCGVENVTIYVFKASWQCVTCIAESAFMDGRCYVASQLMGTASDDGWKASDTFKMLGGVDWYDLHKQEQDR